MGMERDRPRKQSSGRCRCIVHQNDLHETGRGRICFAEHPDSNGDDEYHENIFVNELRVVLDHFDAELNFAVDLLGRSIRDGGSVHEHDQNRDVEL